MLAALQVTILYVATNPRLTAESVGTFVYLPADSPYKLYKDAIIKMANAELTVTEITHGDSPRLVLTVTSGVAKGLACNVEQERVTIGRGKHCSLQITDPFLSEEHCYVEWKGGSCFLKDAGSTDGSGIRLAPSREISPPYPLQQVSILSKQ
jgi:pSer/pThr/pTyr-binding forkhead associated (FHA) protein